MKREPDPTRCGRWLLYAAMLGLASLGAAVGLGLNEIERATPVVRCLR